ncbi:MAG TPA: excisionase family DNA-binding protein [Pseudobdellovibrionaceae bacterium]|jgi:excisionase family DNA binding protein
MRIDSSRVKNNSPSLFEKTNKLVWTIDDVAKELSCSIRHVRKLVSKNRIPYLKVGRLVRFSPQRISEWLHKGGTR